MEWVEEVGFAPRTIKEPRAGDVKYVKRVGSWKIFVLPDWGSKKHTLEFNPSSLTNALCQAFDIFVLAVAIIGSHNSWRS